MMIRHLIALSLSLSLFCPPAFGKLTRDELRQCKENHKSILDNYYVNQVRAMCTGGLIEGTICGAVLLSLGQAGASIMENTRKARDAAKKTAGTQARKGATELAKRSVQRGMKKTEAQLRILEDRIQKIAENQAVEKGARKARQEALKKTLQNSMRLHIQQAVETAAIAAASKLPEKFWRPLFARSLMWVGRLGATATAVGVIAGPPGAAAGTAIDVALTPSGSGCGEGNPYARYAVKSGFCQVSSEPGPELLNFAKLSPEEQEKKIMNDPAVCEYIMNVAKSLDDALKDLEVRDPKIEGYKCAYTTSDSHAAPLIYEADFSANQGDNTHRMKAVDKGTKGGIDIYKKLSKSGHWKKLYTIHSVKNSEREPEVMHKFTVYKQNYFKEKKTVDLAQNPGEDLQPLDSPKVRNFGSKTYTLSEMNALLWERPKLRKHFNIASGVFRLTRDFNRPLMSTCCNIKSKPAQCDALLGKGSKGRQWGNVEERVTH